MKRKEYYLNCYNIKEGQIYPKVRGYVENIEYNGKQYEIGYHKVGSASDTWSATELSTGLKCCKSGWFERKDCIAWVHENIALIDKFMQDLEKGEKDKTMAKCVEDFKTFTKGNPA